MASANDYQCEQTQGRKSCEDRIPIANAALLSYFGDFEVQIPSKLPPTRYSTITGKIPYGFRITVPTY